MDDLNTDKLKKDFFVVLDLRKKIKSQITDISIDINSLKNVYKEMISRVNDSLDAQKKHYMHGIDGFLFQKKLIDMEYENIINLFKMIDNRIYCDYVKIYSIVQEYVNNENSDALIRPLHKQFLPCKLLENTKKYNISYTIEIQFIIINTIIELYTIVKNKQEEIIKHKKQINNGLKIDTLIHTQICNNNIINNNLVMFTQYLETFNKHHNKYLQDLLERCVNLVKYMNSNIRLDNDNDNKNK